jgi:hypothetical protein
MNLAELLAFFDGKIVATYTKAQHAKQVTIARGNRMRWGMGQW